MKNLIYILTGVLLLSMACARTTKTENTRGLTDSIPIFMVDPFWPKPLPNSWLLGQVSGIAVDSKDHIWIIHRPNSIGENEFGPVFGSNVFQYNPAPPVLEFDSDGNLIQTWGGPGEGYDWPEGEHGIYIDHENNVWIGGSGKNDHQVLKFKSDGTFLLQIGEAGKTGGSNDISLLGQPTDFVLDPGTNEIYIADGYLNNRIIVFDAITGKYQRHWGAYGNTPDDSYQKPYDPNLTPSKHFGGVVHAVRISHDELVYVCDRTNNRIQVFQKNGKFLFESIIAKNTIGGGSTWDIDFSRDPQQKYIYVADGTNQRVWILLRDNLKVIGHFGRMGRYAGEFIWIHNLVVDSKGNIYSAEVLTGKRVQKFIYQPKN
jgi:DNA-binding beta-propeller fold protein YncE